MFFGTPCSKPVWLKITLKTYLSILSLPSLQFYLSHCIMYVFTCFLKNLKFVRTRRLRGKEYCEIVSYNCVKKRLISVEFNFLDFLNIVSAIVNTNFRCFPYLPIGVFCGFWNKGTLPLILKICLSTRTKFDLVASFLKFCEMQIGHFLECMYLHYTFAS